MESDEEFWTINQLPAKSKQDKAIESLRATISSLRFSKEEEIQQVTIKVRNQTKRELHEKIQKMEDNLLRRAEQLEEHFNEIRISVYHKDRYIAFLHKLLSEQELFISEHRLVDLPELLRQVKGKEEEQSQVIHKTVVEFPKEEISVNTIDPKKLQHLKLKLESYKELFSDYRRDLDKAKLRIKECESEIERLTHYYEEEIQRIKNNLNKQINNLANENKKMRQDFLNFKVSSNQELSSREMIQDRQNNFIHTLQDELKNAKVLLLNPKASDRLLEKARCYTERHSRRRPRSKKKEQRIEEFCAVKSAISMRRPRTSKDRPVFHMSFRSPNEYTSSSKIKKREQFL